MNIATLQQLAGLLSDDTSITLSAKDIRSLAESIAAPTAPPVVENPITALGDLTVAEVAVSLKCSKAKARALVAKHFLKGYKWGKGYRVQRSDLMAYIAEQRVKAGAR